MAKKRTQKKSNTREKQVSRSTEQMKYEIANEFGVNLGANASSRENGLVGGEMTKRLIENGKSRSNQSQNNSSNRGRKQKKK